MKTTFCEQVKTVECAVIIAEMLSQFDAEVRCSCSQSRLNLGMSRFQRTGTKKFLSELMNPLVSNCAHIQHYVKETSHSLDEQVAQLSQRDRATP